MFWYHHIIGRRLRVNKEDIDSYFKIREEQEFENKKLYKNAAIQYKKLIADFNKFKQEPFKHEIGTTILNWVVIEQGKGKEIICPTADSPFTRGRWWNEYKLVNPITGESSWKEEDFIDDLILANDFLNKAKLKK